MNASNTRYNHTPAMRFWNIIYPVLIYYVVTSAAMYLFTMLAVYLGADYKRQYMMIQAAAVAVTIPVIYRYYEKDRREITVFHEHISGIFSGKSMADKWLNGVLMFLTGAAAGITLNNLMAMTKLEELSQGYQEVNEYFFAGGILFELLGACLLTPFLEELLYRGIVYGRLCDLIIFSNEVREETDRKRKKRSRITAMVISALLFGAIHMNIVQFIYAGILGILLAWFLETAGHLYGAVLGHIGANLMSVLRVETKLFSFMESGNDGFAGATIAFGVISISLIAVIWRRNRE